MVIEPYILPFRNEFLQRRHIEVRLAWIHQVSMYKCCACALKREQPHTLYRVIGFNSHEFLFFHIGGEYHHSVHVPDQSSKTLPVAVSAFKRKAARPVVLCGCEYPVGEVQGEAQLDVLLVLY